MLKRRITWKQKYLIRKLIIEVYKISVEHADFYISSNLSCASTKDASALISELKVEQKKMVRDPEKMGRSLDPKDQVTGRDPARVPSVAPF